MNNILNTLFTNISLRSDTLTKRIPVVLTAQSIPFVLIILDLEKNNE